MWNCLKSNQYLQCNQFVQQGMKSVGFFTDSSVQLDTAVNCFLWKCREKHIFPISLQIELKTANLGTFPTDLCKMDWCSMLFLKKMFSCFLKCLYSVEAVQITCKVLERNGILWLVSLKFCLNILSVKPFVFFHS